MPTTRKYRLFAPGPTAVSQESALAMARQLLHHRTDPFAEVLTEVQEGLKWLFQTKKEVLILASSGTGSMDGAVTNLFSKGDRVIVVEGGKFGERWGNICKAYGVETEIIKVPWGEAVDPKRVEALVKKGGCKGVLVQASESSTAVYHPIKELAAITKKEKECLLVVDAISALGCVDLPMDDWGIDALLAGSQKGMGLPPGLSFVAFSDKGWKAADASDLPKFYFNFKKERKGIIKNETSYTPAISLIFGVQEKLRMMKREGLKQVFERHALLAKATRAGVTAMGLEVFAKSPVNSLTAVKVPNGMDAQKVFKTLQSKYNITIAGGQDAAKGKIFRIGHMGNYDDLDVVTVLAALEWALTDVGHKFQMGAGVAAAMKVLYEAGH
jgi:serine---pyruvate transaminase